MHDRVFWKWVFDGRHAEYIMLLLSAGLIGVAPLVVKHGWHLLPFPSPGDVPESLRPVMVAAARIASMLGYVTVIMITLFGYLFVLMRRAERRSEGVDRFSVHSGPREVYGQMLVDIRDAKETICTTHVRNIFPQALYSDEYQKRIHAWLDAHNERRLQRVVSGRAVAHEHVRDMVGRANACPRYEVKQLQWGPSMPMVNLAIFDRKVAYICLYEGAESKEKHSTIYAVRVQGELAERIGRYFDALWLETEQVCMSDDVPPAVGQ